jgi:PAS domain S-box-containing protein
LGVSFVSLHVPHLVADIEEEMGILALTTGAVFPLFLSVTLVGAGYWLWQSELPTVHLRRIDMWFLLGFGGILIVGGTALMYMLLEGAQLTHLRYVLLNFATAGGVIGVIVGWYDAQNRLRTEQLRTFQQAIEHGGHAVYFTAPDGTIEYVNPEFEEQTGYGQEEAVGETPRLLKSGEQDKQFYKEMWETILSGDVWQNALINARKDGTQYHVEQTIAPVTDEHGNIEHFVAINSDISEIKEYEAELERKNERLDEFASVISHDLRNPLAVASGRVDLARRDYEGEDLDTVKQALDRMERLIEDVLTLTRQGETIGETEPVSLPAICETAWAQVDSIDADLSVQTEKTLMADTSRVQQLLENLFRNAIDHGGDNVTVRIGECDDGFYVEDTGTGFGEETAEQLFESGYTTAEEGTGLGLSIVQRIVDAHGWEITPTTGTEGGARFEITDIGERAPKERP